MRLESMRGAAVAAALLLGACVGTQFVPTNGGVYPPRPADCELEVFASGVPDYPYVEIGIVEGEGSHWKADLQSLLPELRGEACLAGGDAIILGAADKFAVGEEGHPILHVSAVVIRWVGEAGSN